MDEEKKPRHLGKDKGRKGDRSRSPERRRRDRHDRDREDRENRNRRHRDREASKERHHRSSNGRSSRDKTRERDRERDRHGKCSGKDRHREGSRERRKKRSHDSNDEEKIEDDNYRRRKSRRDETERSPALDFVATEASIEEELVREPLLPDENPVLETTAAKALMFKRQSWMLQDQQDAFDFTQRGVKRPNQNVHAGSTRPDYEPIIHKNELNVQLREGKSVDQYKAADVPSYTFGDKGSNWRMMKLRKVYEIARETGREVDDVALERYGDLKAFDEAREEEQELDRRKLYGEGRPDAKEKPTGDLHKLRLKQLNPQRPPKDELLSSPRLGEVVQDAPHTTVTQRLDQSTLNRMKAALLKAQLFGDPKAKDMEKEYDTALAQFANQKEPEVIVLSVMDSRALAHTIGGRAEVKEVTTGRRKGKLEDNEDMTIEDMLKEEKRTRGTLQGGEGRMFADRIARDARFSDNLDYMDENAERLATRFHKSEIDLKNIAINDFKRMQKALDACPLCQHEDRNAPPIAPVISLGTRVFLTLPTEPELSLGGAVIAPIQHRINTMECDDDEWEEIRNFMKSLVRMYHDEGRGVIFYENAANPGRKRHAAIEAIPLPLELAETAPAYFREAILSSDDEWSQHKKILDTLSRARKEGLGKRAFRQTLVKEMPYFHVWFEIDGGMGHIVENQDRWPKGDLFAREVIGGMLDLDPSIYKKQGRWTKGKDKREDRFKKQWHQFDWTRVLLDGTTSSL